MENKKILIIEDEESVRHMMRLVLEKTGCSVLEAPNGREGLKAYHQYRPDLVITDIFMPEMEGLETIMALRRENPGVKIIAVSGGGASGYDYLPAALKLGCSRALAKPFAQKDLLGAVRDLLEADDNAGP